MADESKCKATVSSLDTTTKTYLKVKGKYSIHMLDHILSFFSEDNGLIVEAGPGLGHFAEECIKKGFDYLGFEASPALYRNLIDSGFNIKQEYVPPFSLEDKICDIVYASMIIEHFPTYIEATHFISETFRILKDNGLVCLVVPNYLTCKEFFFEMDYTHSFTTTKRRLRNLLRDNALEVVDVQHVIGWFWVKSGFFHHILRHFINIFMVPFHFGFTTWVFEYIGQENLLWKLRKTFFESLIIVAQKGGN